MTDFADIIARLEKATGPDRELDDAIGATLERPCKNWPFTASIDAALTLVPGGFRWKLGYSRHVPCVADLIDYGHRSLGCLGHFDGECDSNHAIALCIAALKARAIA